MLRFDHPRCHSPQAAQPAYANSGRHFYMLAGRLDIDTGLLSHTNIAHHRHPSRESHSIGKSFWRGGSSRPQQHRDSVDEAFVFG
ncbi:hypothetical protein ACKVWC_011375 [Pyricularia oryzae]